MEIAPENLCLDIEELERKAEFAEISLKRPLEDIAEEIHKKFLESSPIENPDGFNGYMVLQEWLDNADFHGNADISKSRCFVSKHEDYFYLGLEDNGHGFNLAAALKHWVGPFDRGKGLSVICRQNFNYIYNINEPGKHTIVGIKTYLPRNM